jgi:hypothetical protein
MTTKELAEKSGVPFSTVTRILSDRTDATSFQNIYLLVWAMGGSLDEFGSAIFPEKPIITDPKKREQKITEAEETKTEALMQAYKSQNASRGKWLIFVVCLVVALIGVLVGVLVRGLFMPE